MRLLYDIRDGRARVDSFRDSQPGPIFSSTEFLSQFVGALNPKGPNVRWSSPIRSVIGANRYIVLPLNIKSEYKNADRIATGR